MPISSNIKINTHIGVAYAATSAKIGEGEFGGGATETRTFSSTNNISLPVTSSVHPTLGISGSNPYQPIEGAMTKPIPASSTFIVLDTFNYPNFNPDGSLTNNYDTFSPYSYVKLEGIMSPPTSDGFLCYSTNVIAFNTSDTANSSQVLGNGAIMINTTQNGVDITDYFEELDAIPGSNFGTMKLTGSGYEAVMTITSVTYYSAYDAYYLVGTITSTDSFMSFPQPSTATLCLPQIYDADEDISFFRVDFATNFLPNGGVPFTICTSYPNIETYVGYESIINSSYMYWFSEDYNNVFKQGDFRIRLNYPSSTVDRKLTIHYTFL